MVPVVPGAEVCRRLPTPPAGRPPPAAGWLPSPGNPRNSTVIAAETTRCVATATDASMATSGGPDQWAADIWCGCAEPCARRGREADGIHAVAITGTPARSHASPPSPADQSRRAGYRPSSDIRRRSGRCSRRSRRRSMSSRSVDASHGPPRSRRQAVRTGTAANAGGGSTTSADAATYPPLAPPIALPSVPNDVTLRSRCAVMGAAALLADEADRMRVVTIASVVAFASPIAARSATWPYPNTIGRDQAVPAPTPPA